MTNVATAGGLLSICTGVISLASDRARGAGALGGAARASSEPSPALYNAAGALACAVAVALCAVFAADAGAGAGTGAGARAPVKGRQQREHGGPAEDDGQHGHAVPGALADVVPQQAGAVD